MTNLIAADERCGIRRRPDDDTWHFCSNCSGWPRVRFVEQWVKPENGEVCRECEQRRREGSCRTESLRL
jgi:hypothetical protein